MSSSSSDSASAPGIVPVATVTHSRHAEQRGRSSQTMFEDEMIRAGPHRCASRLDDFVIGLYNFKFDTARSRWALFRQCMNNPGNEPRDPHLNLPVARLPRWDPMHPEYDPDAPFDSFHKPLKKTEAEVQAILEQRRLQREEQWTQMQQQQR